MTYSSIIRMLLEWISCLCWIVPTNLHRDYSPRKISSKGSARRTRPFVSTKQLVSFVAPLFFALAGMTDGAITNCWNVNPNQWIQIESGYYCSAVDWCPSGWSWEAYTPCYACCSRDGCKREVCKECYSGSYKSGFSEGYATLCTRCPDILGCTSRETCSAASNSKCQQCARGRYLKPALKDSCPYCSNIDGCDWGRTTCTSSSNQVCSKCKNGYFLSNSKKTCTKCPAHFYCDGIGQFDCWDSFTFCPETGTTSDSTRQDKCEEDRFSKRCDKKVTCVLNQGTCIQDKCWSLRGDGTCTECSPDNAGKNCEHSVCG